MKLEGSNPETLLKISGSYWAACTLHGEGPDACSMIIKKAIKALEPEGLIAIHEFVLDNTLDGPVYPALFSLSMLLGTDQGQAYSEEQITGMLAENDAGDIRRLPLGGADRHLDFSRQKVCARLTN